MGTLASHGTGLIRSVKRFIAHVVYTQIFLTFVFMKVFFTEKSEFCKNFLYRFSEKILWIILFKNVL